MRKLLTRSREAGALSTIAALLISSLVPAGTALAHHSYAAYDQSSVKTVKGTLEDFDWSAPHSSMTVVYLDNTGNEQRVSATTGAPNTIVRQGFKIADFKVGMKVELRWYPNVNGSPGGEMALLKLPDGRMLRGHGYEQFDVQTPAKTN
jgi:hypothetical protein